MTVQALVKKQQPDGGVWGEVRWAGGGGVWCYQGAQGAGGGGRYQGVWGGGGGLGTRSWRSVVCGHCLPQVDAVCQL